MAKASPPPGGVRATVELDSASMNAAIREYIADHTSEAEAKVRSDRQHLAEMFCAIAVENASRHVLSNRTL